MTELLCVDCAASGLAQGEDRWRLAVYLIDGRSLCQDHGRAMVKVIAGGRAGEQGDGGTPV